MKTTYKIVARRTDSNTKWIVEESKSINRIGKLYYQIKKAWEKFPNIKLKIIEITEKEIKL